MNEDALRPFLDAPEVAGIFLDFDGTLSEIVHIPSEARPLDGVAATLARLAVRFKLVAIVSGRSAAQLVEWFGPEAEVWGVHGAERSVGGRVELSERAEPFSALMARVKEDAARRVAALRIDGVLVEDKGVMLGLHFRAAADRDRARRELDAIADELAAGYGLRRAGGRLAFELRPPVEFSKEIVVLQRAREATLKAAAFVGDDRVDLPAFDALDELAKQGVATLRVAVDSDEAPPELIERADIVVPGPAGVLELLSRLAA
jgi:trehalose 6-phosphate phosphatase